MSTDGASEETHCTFRRNESKILKQLKEIVEQSLIRFMSRYGRSRSELESFRWWVPIAFYPRRSFVAWMPLFSFLIPNKNPDIAFRRSVTARHNGVFPQTNFEIGGIDKRKDDHVGKLSKRGSVSLYRTFQRILNLTFGLKKKGENRRQRLCFFLDSSSDDKTSTFTQRSRSKEISSGKEPLESLCLRRYNSKLFTFKAASPLLSQKCPTQLCSLSWTKVASLHTHKYNANEELNEECFPWVSCRRIWQQKHGQVRSGHDEPPRRGIWLKNRKS